MVQRPIVMSAIAPVAVAAILILGILAGISSTAAAQLSKLVKKPYVSKTVKTPYVSKTVKTPYVSKTVKTPYVSKTVKTPYVKMGATKSAYAGQGASNRKKRTELTISATQTGPARPQEENSATGEIFTLVPVTLSGRLTSEGSGVAGASLRAANAEVRFHCDDSTCNGEERTNTGAHVTAYSVTPDRGGHYSVVVLLGDHNHKTHKIDVTLEPSNPNEPSDYEKSHATTTIQLNKGSPEGKRTELTISATPTGPAKGLNIPVKISGRLTSEGSGVAGATIRITSWANICTGEDCTEMAPHDARTDSGGHYSIATTISGDKKSTYSINAMTKHIPSNYEDSKATTTIKLP